MKPKLAWWYSISLPKREPDTTPAERERSRYAHLTSAFSLVLFIISLMTTIYGVLTSINPAAPIIELIAFGAMVVSLIFNKLGFSIAAATFLILNSEIVIVGNLLTNPLDPAFVPILCALVVPVILAGSLMPPVSALLVGTFNSIVIVLLSIFQKHTAYYDQMVRIGYYSIMVALPIFMQVVVAVVTYFILSNLITTIRRADRAEEIISLQKEIAEHQRQRALEQGQLEEGISIIAQVHTAVANGYMETRVPLGAENVLWQIAVPLNNLLNRVQYWKISADQLERTQKAAQGATREMQKARILRTQVIFQQATGTPIDSMLPEINYLSEQVVRSGHL